MAAKVTTLEELKKAIDPTLGLRYIVLHEDSDIHLGFYAPGNPDPQLPHEQDEFYLVASGTGEILIGSEVTSLGTGDAIFVPAHEGHRLQNHSDDFTVWVLFWCTKNEYR